VKVVLNGETFDYEPVMPMADALALEKAWGRRYVEWESLLGAGSAEAFGVLAWLIWRRDGRDIELSAILDGSVPLDLAEMLASVITARAEQEAAQADPTPAGPPTDPAGTPTTQPGTKPSSPRSST